MSGGLTRIAASVLCAISLCCNNADTSGADSGDPPDDCSHDGQLTWAYALFQDVYLWREELPELDPTSYLDAESLADDLRYDALDQWSRITETEEHDAWYEDGKYVGLGYKLRYDASGQLRVALVYPGSPAADQGLKRGDIVLEINTFTIDEIEEYDLWSVLYGATRPGREIPMRVASVGGDARDITLTMDWVDTASVLAARVIESNGETVGYFMLTAFLGITADELDATFAEFGEAGIDRLVVDLRYNGGGSLTAAGHMAGLIGGADFEGEIFARYTHNANHTGWDGETVFEHLPETLSLNQITLLTSGSTASASETLINGLRPWMPVTLVGTSTRGKPVGMYQWDYCGLTAMPISFRMENAIGETDWYDGFAPDCTVSDDLDHGLGDPDEARFSAALGLLAGQSCPSAGPPAPTTRAQPGPSVGFLADRDAW